MSDGCIAVYGATGYTGRLVARRLVEQVDHVVLSARNEVKLGALRRDLSEEGGAMIDVRPAAVDEPQRLDMMLDGVAVLINCAGPFVDIGEPVVRAAVRNEVHYFDTTGEQPFMKLVRDEFDERASEAGIVLAPATAFEYALGDFAAAVAADRGARDIAICYAARQMGASHGTKKSIIRALSSEGYTFVDGQLAQRRPAYRTFDVPLPGDKRVTGAWFPGGAPLTVPQFADVDRIEECVAVGATVARCLNLASPLFEPVVDIAGGLIDRLIEMTNGEPHEQAADPDFAVVSFDPDAGKLYAAILGEDPYRATSRIIAEAAMRTFNDEPATCGFTSPAALFDAPGFVEAVDLQLVDTAH